MKIDQRFWVVRNIVSGEVFKETQNAGDSRIALYNSIASCNRAIASRNRHGYNNGYIEANPDYIEGYKYDRAKGYDDFQKYGHKNRFVKVDYPIWQPVEVKITEVIV